MAEQYVKLGASISVAGPITYKNNRRTVEMVEAIGLEHLMIETDAPYLTPEPHRGKRNKSPYVAFTAMKIASIKGISLEEVAKVTCQNAKTFFGIV
jgi:TatD DNase family protein